MNEGKSDRERWNTKYRRPGFEMPDGPIPALEERVDGFPDGRALDVATGTGRNALFLAEKGYEVDAVDVSDEALSVASERADERDVSVNWILADADEHVFPRREYDVVTTSFYYNMNRLTTVKESVDDGGFLVYQHHLRVRDSDEDEDTDEVVGPDDDRLRLAPNELLRACLDMRIVSYEEVEERTDDGRLSATATVVARREG